MTSTPGKQGGLTIVSAIFLLVVLGVLGSYMVTMGSVQHVTSGISIQGARAHAAAVSGIDWAVYDIRNNAAANLNCNGPPGSEPAFTLFGIFNVTVSCASQNVTEGAVTYGVYHLTSSVVTPGSPGDPGYVSRTVWATVAD